MPVGDARTSPSAQEPGHRTPVVIQIDALALTDDHTFIGRVRVGDVEAYRTIRSYAASVDAKRAAAHLLAGLLGPRLAGQEWHALRSATDHTPRRTDFQSTASPRPAPE